MNELDKQGFCQFFTYFTWRNSKKELTDYVTELTTNRTKRILSPELLAKHARY